MLGFRTLCLLSCCSSQPFRLMDGEAGLLAAGGLASSPLVGVPVTPPFSWTGKSCRGDQPGLVSGHWLTVGPGNVEKIGGCLVLVSSPACVWGFGSEVVNVTAALGLGTL